MSRSSGARLGACLFAVAAATLLPTQAVALPAAGDVPAATPGTIAGAWIVTLEPGASPDRVSDDHARRHGAQVDHVYAHALRGYAARMSDRSAARVAEDPRVASVQRDRVVTATDHEARHTWPNGVDRIDAELSTTADIDADGSNVDVDVAIIDSGIAAHPDLRIEGGVNCSSGKSYSDGNGHGTHVAGTVGAKDDGKGVVGVAPGARLWAVRVLDNRGSGSWSSVICGIDWVTQPKVPNLTIEVANMSLGGVGTEPADGVIGDCGTGDALHDAVCESVTVGGVTYAVAAGNDAVDASGAVPAAYDEVITVSALADFNGLPNGGAAATCRTDVDDTFANFSNYGADVDLIAPGVCIKSTWLKGGFNTISGTSMASPHVAGAAALYKANHPTALPAEVRAKLRLEGTAYWSDAERLDGDKEPLLNVKAF